jgi:hypothetical protein
MPLRRPATPAGACGLRFVAPLSARAAVARPARRDQDTCVIDRRRTGGVMRGRSAPDGGEQVAEGDAESDGDLDERGQGRVALARFDLRLATRGHVRLEGDGLDTSVAALGGAHVSPLLSVNSSAIEVTFRRGRPLSAQATSGHSAPAPPERDPRPHPPADEGVRTPAEAVGPLPPNETTARPN